jgi:hypothetical protein
MGADPHIHDEFSYGELERHASHPVALLLFFEGALPFSLRAVSRLFSMDVA